MQKVAFGAVIGLLVAACGSSSPVHVIDSGSGSGGSGGAICDPVAQTGCPSGDRCTWVQDTASVGHIDCEGAAGSGALAAIGATCGAFEENDPTMSAVGSDGNATYPYFDNCAAGGICIGGTCETICDSGAGSAACATGYACGEYTGLFEVNGNFEAGACDKTCDALNDNSFGSGGSGDVIPPKTGTTCASGDGCYGGPSSDPTSPTHFTCSGEVNTTLVNRTDCTVANGCAPDSTESYLNGCAQGYFPGLLDGAVGSTQAICAAYCAPDDCWMGNCGSNSLAAQGGSGATLAHDCTKTSIRDDPGYPGADGQPNNSCFYMWNFEIDDSTGVFTPSPTDDTVGICLDHAKYRVDSNGNGQIDGSDAVLPNCVDLPGSGSAGPYGLDAPFNGCTDVEQAVAAGDLGSGSGSGGFRIHKARRLTDLPRFPAAVLGRRMR